MPPILPLLCFLASLGTLWVAAPTSQAADVIYSYVDDEGVPHFTDQWQLIPENYRSRIQQLDPSTGKPVSRATGTALQDRSAQRPAVAQNRTAPTPTEERPFYADWLDAFSRLKIPALSSGQLTIGLTAVVLFGLLVKVSRRIKNPFVKLALKGAVLAIAFGGAYLMYFFILDSQISQLSPDGSQSTVTGQDLMRGVQGATEKAKSTVDKVVAPLEKFKDATVGKAARTRDQMNQSNRETEKVIQKLESQP